MRTNRSSTGIDGVTRALAIATLALTIGACSSGSGSGDAERAMSEGVPGAIDPDAGQNPPAPFDPVTEDQAGTSEPQEETASTEEPEPSPPPDDEPLAYRTPAGIVECSTEDLRAKVDFDMRDYYIYYDRVPSPDLEAFDTPERLIRALRVDPDVYSFVADLDETTQLREEGIAEGYGFWFLPAADGTVRFREIVGGSPAAAAGLSRGDELVALDGLPIGEYDDAMIGEALDGGAVTLSVRSGDERVRDVRVESAEYRWLTAPRAEVTTLDASGLRVGYLRVDRFLDTTEAEIDEHLRGFEAQGGIDELILDMRYNPGGRSRVAQQLAAQIGGTSIEGEIYQIARANDKYGEFDFETRFEAAPVSLDLPRVIVLLTEFSASASEAVANGLAPYLDVVVVGTRSEGKPFTSFSEDYCGKSINAMSFLRTNAAGVDVIGGVEPTCTVEDDWRAPADDGNDPLFRAALDYVESGTCRTRAASAPRRRAAGIGYRGMSPAQLEPLDVLDRGTHALGDDRP